MRSFRPSMYGRRFAVMGALAGALALATPGAALAAGSHEEGHDHGHGDAHDAAGIGEPGKPGDVSRTLTITMTDNAYQPDRISVHRGETIRFVVRNAGQAVHEFNIGTAAMHAAHRDEMMAMMEKGVIGGGKIDRRKMRAMDMTHDHANSLLLEPGGEKSVIWRFSEAGDLEFACNVPGHYESGMVGRFAFEHDHGD